MNHSLSIIVSLVGSSALLAFAQTTRSDRANSAEFPSAGRVVEDEKNAPNSKKTWLAEVQANLRQSEYHVTWQNPPTAVNKGTFQAPNRSNGFRTYFTADGVRVVPRTAHKDEAATWEWNPRLTSIGRAGAMEPIPNADLRAEGNRIDYDRGDVVEWYVNDERGLEQGFTLLCAPPDSSTQTDDRLLRLDMTVGGNLLAQVAFGGGAIDFLAPGGALAIHYSKLKVTDASGRELSSSFEVDGDRVSILVNDREAVYPVTIDPLASNPAWTAESNQSESFFGKSVATAGDVNGDGYSDVIVGAPGYDGGGFWNGRAFIYLGSAAGLAASPAWTATEAGVDDSEFGISVATAGDVNGDGYSDVIVGAWAYGLQNSREGRAYVYLGSATGLSRNPGWMAESNQLNSAFGISVATAGDVNGDGFSDIIVGAYSYDDPNPGGDAEGHVFVWHGSATGLGPNGTPENAAWRAQSNIGLAYFGSSVSTAGDVNGDGYSDIIVGAWGFNSNTGAVYVWHGSATGLGPDGIPANADWGAEGAQPFDAFGETVATAGDITGDGYSDIIVSAPGFTNGQANEGAAFVWHGSATGLGPTGTTANADWIVEGNQVNSAYALISSGTAGDVNGDGYGDLVVGFGLSTNGQANEGRAFIWLGSSTGLGSNGTPSNADWSAESDQASAQFGCSVATAGDVNGDGLSDVIVGALEYDNPSSNEGRAYLYLGGTDGPADTPGWSDDGGQAGANLGWSVASAGDVNGDGYADVVVGAPAFDNGQVGEGRAFLYLGGQFGPSSSPNWTSESNQANAQYGWAVAGAGDVNGDGYDDVIVSALAYDNGEIDEGRVWLFLGSASGLGATSSWRAESNQASALFGNSIGTAGDVNGDGYSDVIIGANTYDNGQTDEGRAFVWYGSSSDLGADGTPANADWSAESNQSSARFGNAVATAGDVNGDGYSDVIVGARQFDNGQTDEGRAYVYYGGSSGLAASAAWIGEVDLAGDRFGYSVACAGDVNGDGYSDVVVGAPNYTNGQADEGIVYVFHGSITGLTAVPMWSVESHNVGALLGYSVASAGDVNGDGYSDIIMGAPNYSNGQTDEGRAFVFLGSSSGLAAAADWNDEGDQTSATFGTSVACAGDVNGDGYSDIIIGVPGVEGRADIYFGNGEGRAVRPRQLRASGGAPIAHLGISDSGTGFRIEQVGRSSLGRGKARLEWEVKPLGTLLNGMGLQHANTWSSTGIAGALMNEPVSGLSGLTVYHWRFRTCYDIPTSPFQQRGRWIHVHSNGGNEADLRTPVAPITCPADVAPPSGDGLVNVNDLLAVINGWGPCALPCPPYCTADINHDCVVNVNDLLAVINAWGVCP